MLQPDPNAGRGPHRDAQDHRPGLHLRRDRRPPRQRVLPQRPAPALRPAGRTCPLGEWGVRINHDVQYFWSDFYQPVGGSSRPPPGPASATPSIRRRSSGARSCSRDFRCWPGDAYSGGRKARRRGEEGKTRAMPPSPRRPPKILLITTDEQRYDTLGSKRGARAHAPPGRPGRAGDALHPRLHPEPRLHPQPGLHHDRALRAPARRRPHAAGDRHHAGPSALGDRR